MTEGTLSRLFLEYTDVLCRSRVEMVWLNRILSVAETSEGDLRRLAASDLLALVTCTRPRGIPTSPERSS